METKSVHNQYLTKEIYGNRLNQYLLAVVIAVLTYTFTALIVNPVRFEQRFSILSIIAYSILAIITVEGNRWIARILDQRIVWYEEPLKRLTIQSILTVLWVILVLGLPTYVYIIFNLHMEYDYLLFIILGVTFGAILLISIHIGRSFFYNWQYSLLQNERLKQEKLQHDYEMLQNHLNPHFLFNNLNVLIAQIRTDQDKAVLFVEHFAEIYRYVLQNRNTRLVSLQKEIDFLESYQYLLQIRFGNNLHVDMNISKEYFQYKLPPLTLQILMENAVKHNVINNKHPLRITLEIQDGGYLSFGNTLQKKSGIPSSTHFGLATIKDRYAFFTQKTVNILENEESFIVDIPLLHDN